MAKFKKKNKKKFTSEQKYRYHADREGALAKHGLEWGSPAHLYSSGFTDGFHHIDNKRAVKSEFGIRCSNSYAIGNARGRKAAMEYFHRTGKQPSSLSRYDD